MRWHFHLPDSWQSPRAHSVRAPRTVLSLTHASSNLLPLHYDEQKDVKETLSVKWHALPEHSHAIRLGWDLKQVRKGEHI
jgi:hypothetical protein